jgi:acyl carrier protein
MHGRAPWLKETKHDRSTHPRRDLERNLGASRRTDDLGLASIDAVVLGEALVQHYRRPIPFKELMAEIGRRTERDLSIGELVTFLEAHLGD